MRLSRTRLAYNGFYSLTGELHYTHLTLNFSKEKGVITCGKKKQQSREKG